MAQLFWLRSRWLRFGVSSAIARSDLHSSLAASRCWFLSRFISRRADLLSLCWRGAFVLMGLLYLGLDMTAQLQMKALFPPAHMPAPVMAHLANNAVAWFPFDPDVRKVNRYVQFEIAQYLAAR